MESESINASARLNSSSSICRCVSFRSFLAALSAFICFSRSVSNTGEVVAVLEVLVVTVAALVVMAAVAVEGIPGIEMVSLHAAFSLCESVSVAVDGVAYSERDASDCFDNRDGRTMGLGTPVMQLLKGVDVMQLLAVEG